MTTARRLRMFRHDGRTAAFMAVLAVACLSTAGSAAAEELETILLWPDGAPGATGNDQGDQPRILVALPERNPTGTAVVICPGGGYGGLAMDHEGYQIASWLNGMDVAGVILDYRHRGKGYGHPAPMLDVQRALRTVRSRATAWNIDTARVGVLGFSAGGHLAATAATQFDEGDAEADDPVERQSCRPDFAVLCYPVIAFDEEFTHRGSQRNLLGPEPDAELIRRMSAEKSVTSATPPTFLWHTHEDRGVPPENSVVFYRALRRHGVPSELHVFERGRHGVGLATEVPGTSAWPGLCRAWLETQGFVAPAE